MQRDLSDSTVMRNLGVAFSYTLIALQSIAKGNEKLQINRQALINDLNQNIEVISEAIQTVMRLYNVPEAYEQLKQLTRGQEMTQEKLQQFIDTLDIPDKARKTLKALTPETYTGLASVLVKSFI